MCGHTSLQPFSFMCVTGTYVDVNPLWREAGAICVCVDVNLSCVYLLVHVDSCVLVCPVCMYMCTVCVCVCVCVRAGGVRQKGIQ